METLGDWIDVAPWKARTLVLVCVGGVGDVEVVNTVTDKRRVLRTPGTSIVAIWPGEWSTTARRVTRRDRAELLDREDGPLA